jgi:uncharacterized protein (TIGR03083 family)
MVSTAVVATTKGEKLAALEAERREILDLYRHLEPSDWEHITLCTLWSARDLLAHLITNETPPLWAFITSGFNLDQANQKLIDGLKHLSNEQLVERWASMVVPKGMPTWSPETYLADDWVHHQDVRWALSYPRQQDQARLRLVLSALHRLYKKRIAGLHLIANDLGWEYGETGQPEVRGSAEALAMGIADRPAAREQLTGSGLERLLPSAIMRVGGW